VLALAAVAAGCGAQPGAPRLEVANRSSTWLRVSVWSPETPGGFAPGRSIVVGPRATVNFSPKDLPPTPPLRLEVEAIGPVVRWARPAWLEVTAGGPHRLEAGGQERDLWLTPAPPESWTALTRDTAAVVRTPEGDPANAAPGADAWMPPLGPEPPGTPDNPPTPSRPARPRSVF
jgi:hypothetical protein